MIRLFRSAIVMLSLIFVAAAPALAQSRAAAKESGGGREESAASAVRPRAKLSGVINLNQADAEALELLPGIGPTRAAAIVEYRKSRPFKRVDDLVRIKGIGKKTMVKLRPYLAVSGQTTLTLDQPGEGDEDKDTK
ncbi:MAG TPA: helix-hairpin-helix domain-containing protein [Polyangia bacterium]|jgi:competence protein ComEA|nr:helix-hairpin-helix domain-containing protein [Polyangia bacterium]